MYIYIHKIKNKMITQTLDSAGYGSNKYNIQIVGSLLSEHINLIT